VRKWEVSNQPNFPDGWKYGISNPENSSEYLFSNCPGKLFIKFKTLYYENCTIGKFRKFLLWLEVKEGKLLSNQYNKPVNFL